METTTQAAIRTIREKAERSGFTLSDVAYAAGVDKAQVSRWSTGKVTPLNSAVIKLQEACNALVEVRLTQLQQEREQVSYVIGIDPGISGAISVFRDNVLHSVVDMPTLEVDSGKTKKRHISAVTLRDILEIYPTAHVVVEKVGAMPGQGVSSMFNFGRSAGIIEGVVAALRMPSTYVTPATWTKGVGRAAGKDASRMRAMELFPAKADLFKRAKDDGRADAALIAYWYLTKNA